MAGLVVKSKVKEYAAEMSVGSDFYDALCTEVEGLIDKAKIRCKENGRATMKARDL